MEADQEKDVMTKRPHLYEGEHLRNLKDSSPSMTLQIENLKRSLINWKDVLVCIKSILEWEKHWHPTALLAGSTIFFTLLWLLDPSFLTLISIIGIFITVNDYIGPTVASTLFRPAKWTEKKERDFDVVCMNLIIYKAKLEISWANYYKMRTTNSKMYYFSTLLTLGFLAWIGCTFNNLFLAYLTFTVALLYPGLEHNGMINKWTNSIWGILGGIIDQAKLKVQGQGKKDK